MWTKQYQVRIFGAKVNVLLFSELMFGLHKIVAHRLNL